MEDRSNLDHRGRRSSPLREGGDAASEGGIVDLIDEDPEEGGGIGVRVVL